METLTPMLGLDAYARANRSAAGARAAKRASEEKGVGGLKAMARIGAAAKALKANAEHVDWGGTSKKRMNEWVTIDALAVLQASGQTRA